MAEIFQRGVDVSRYQGQIDWNKVKAAGQQYAIVRAVSIRGSAPYVDPLFEQNIRQAAAAGLRVGVYYYTYATTEAQAIRELDTLLPQLEMIRQYLKRRRERRREKLRQVIGAAAASGREGKDNEK